MSESRISSRTGLENRRVDSKYTRPILQSFRKILQLALGNAIYDDGVKLLFPDSDFKCEIVVSNRRISVKGMASDQIVAAFRSEMDAGRIDGQRQIALKRSVGGEDVRIAAARLHWHVETGHLGDEARARTGGIDDRTGPDKLSGAQPYSLHCRSGPVDGGQFVGDVLDPVVASLVPPPVDHRRRIEIAFIDKVETAADDIVELVERILCAHLGGGDDPGCGPGVGLRLLIPAQDVQKVLVVGEIEIAEILDTEFGNALIAAEVGAKILDEFRRILRDTYVDGAGELLPHAVVARGGRRPLVCRVPLDNENSALEVLVAGQIPSCSRTHASPADDDYIVVFS